MGACEKARTREASFVSGARLCLRPVDAGAAHGDQADPSRLANILVLLRVLRGELRGLDLSRLALRGVSLQGIQMQDARLSKASLQNCTFTEPFGALAAVAMSRSGQYWAAATWRGEVWVWAEAGMRLHLVWQAHATSVPALAFSPDGR